MTKMFNIVVKRRNAEQKVQQINIDMFETESMGLIDLDKLKPFLK